ncbi:MAG: hypothetical protein ABSG13_03810 [Bryobacteraceae bacterium]
MASAPVVSDTGSNSVSVIDAASRKELTRVAVGKDPKRLIAVDLPQVGSKASREIAEGRPALGPPSVLCA